jgi:glycosyltransferase involved in cell wall biosynthesis
VMEAMAAALPVVATAVGGVPNLLENGREGFLVQPGNVQDLSNAMSLFLGNRELRQSLGKAAAHRAREKFDVSAMVQAYEEMYETLLDPAHRLEAETVVPRQTASLPQA